MTNALAEVGRSISNATVRDNKFLKNNISKPLPYWEGFFYVQVTGAAQLSEN